jgi:hypothetical protein
MIEWESAACLSVGSLPFFAESKGVSYAAAKRVCAGCPVAAPCLELGMDTDVGMYGGATPMERRRIRKARAA